MQLHQVKPKRKLKNKKRVGRGGKRGTYSGRGVKGQKARAGRKIRPEIRDYIKKIPKKRGYKFNPLKKKQVVNLKDLEKNFKKGEIVSPKTLLKKGLIAKVKGRIPEVKILGSGELKKDLVFKDCDMSESVKRVVSKK
ncbi:MAG: 50S ribosomal protein L15 [Candidatus Portnoybacteria bacterium]|nr:50S ribosomal protein L15 [Candidatus Portnoybacteria bacterium]